MRVFGTRDFRWRADRLYFGTNPTGYSIVCSSVHPTMWRVRAPDGDLSDIVNRTRAKDAAEGLALAVLNRQGKAAGGPLVR